MNNRQKEPLGIIANSMLSDRLNTLAAEYSTTTKLLGNLALKRLIDDIDFMRELRSGKVFIE